MQSSKTQPSAQDLEQAVLGAILLDSAAIGLVADILRPQSFYNDKNGKIYEAAIELFADSKPVDLLTITEQLRKKSALDFIGGALYLIELTNRVASAANVEYHARIVAQKYIQRELIRVSTGTINEAFEDTTDVFDLLDKAEHGLFSITNGTVNRAALSMATLIHQAVTQISKNTSNDGLTGIPSGFMALDQLTSGWQQSDLIIMAARPGMGKTSFVLAMACNAAIQFGKGVAVFSLEMSSLQITNRLLSLLSNVSGERLRTGNLTEWEAQQIHTAAAKLQSSPIFVDDTPAISVFELRAKCRRLKMQHDIQLIVIDYLQLMTGTEAKSGGNREQEIASISRALKQIAKELNVPVITLSQLSRAVEVRGGSKRPQLSDLRESGSLEQDADIVGFIYRPEYYGILEDEDGNTLQGIAEIIVAKHRNGALDTVKLQWNSHCAKFCNLDDGEALGFEIANSIFNISDFEPPPATGNEQVAF